MRENSMRTRTLQGVVSCTIPMDPFVIQGHGTITVFMGLESSTTKRPNLTSFRLILEILL